MMNEPKTMPTLFKGITFRLQKIREHRNRSRILFCIRKMILEAPEKHPGAIL